jgi:signal transduction histidine kinase
MPLNILMLEDQPDDADLVAFELDQAGFEYNLHRVDNEADFAAALHEGLDLILADYTLPQYTGMRALRLMQERELDIPFIIVTGSLGEETVVECLKQGATDYLLKDRLTRIGHAISQALQQKKLRDEKRKADEALRQYTAELEQRVAERTAELQAALQKEKELNELKQRFVSMVSHEFRNPLAAIQSSSELVRNYSHKMDEQRKHRHLDSIATQVSQLTELLDDVLFISKAQSVGMEFKPTTLNLEAFCRKIAQEFQQTASNHQIVFTPRGHSVETRADEKLMRQVVANLLSNAVKYSPQGGIIHFHLFYEDEKAIIQVQDQGIGIPEEDHKHLFEVFHRAGNVGAISGTGLGLAIIKQAVEVHGGSISFESQVGSGTTFTVCLPLGS